jgi:hypothetical protein
MCFLTVRFFNIWSSNSGSALTHLNQCEIVDPQHCSRSRLLPFEVPALRYPAETRPAGNTDLHAAGIGRLQLQQRLRQRRVDERVVHVSKHLHHGHSVRIADPRPRISPVGTILYFRTKSPTNLSTEVQENAHDIFCLSNPVYIALPDQARKGSNSHHSIQDTL